MERVMTMKREGYTITDYANFYDFTHKKWSDRQGYKIDRIVPHHMAGNLTPQQFYSIMHSKREMSPTVAVFSDGQVWAYVPEEKRAWTTGSWECDKSSLTLEIANDNLQTWHVSDKAYESAIYIMADWCIRYNIEPTYTYRGKGINMHKDWNATACPGQYLEQKIKTGQMEKDIRKVMNELTGRTKIQQFVTSLYKTILNRKPDEDGLNYWSDNLLNKTKSAEQVVKGFFNSMEYLKKKKSNENFVKDCYKAILLRNYDKEGFEYWVNNLKKGMTRDNVLNGFLQSKEFDAFKKKYDIN